MQPTMTIEISPDGSVSVKVGCVKGAACKEVSRKIEQALGTVVKDQPTAEINEVDHAEHRNPARR